MSELLYKDEDYAIVDASIEVYNQLGPGFFEAVYQEALEIELAERAIPFQPQPELLIYYNGIQLKKTYIAYFLAFEKVVIEIKALKIITAEHESQLLNELKATGLPVGLLINFSSSHKLEWKRLIYTPKNIKIVDPVPYSQNSCRLVDSFLG